MTAAQWHANRMAKIFPCCVIYCLDQINVTLVWYKNKNKCVFEKVLLMHFISLILKKRLPVTTETDHIL